MRFTYTKRSSSLIAVAAIVFTSLTFWLLLTDKHDRYASHIGFWLGLLAATVSTLVLGITSYSKGRNGLSNKDIGNAKKTLGGLTFMRKTVWVWYPLISIFVSLYLDHGYHPFIMGIGVGFGIFLSLMVLLDNLVFHGIFMWNIQDPRIKKLYTKAGK